MPAFKVSIFMFSDPSAKELLSKFFLPRPSGQLRSLSPKMRWEVTRRHPLYLSLWALAPDCADREQVEKGVSADVQQIAAGLLWTVGVSRGAPDPKLEFEDLGGGLLRNGWLSGAIAPLEVRGLLALLITAIPPDQFVETVVNITHEMCMEANEEKRRDAGLRALLRLKVSELDQLIDEPIVSINPRFASRQIKKELDESIARWQEERSIPETRNRSTRHTDYLRVWDLREGWFEGGYDNSREMQLKEVAKALRRNLSTVNQQYRSAFELITGHPYSPEMWFRFMALVKVPNRTCEAIGRVTQSRPRVSPTARDIPSSVVTPRNSPDFVTQMAESRDSDPSMSLNMLGLDIADLLKRGKTNQEILQTLELPQEAGELVEIYRGHLAISESGRRSSNRKK